MASFQKNYRAEIIYQTGKGPVYHFPSTANDGMRVQFTSSTGANWIGIFAPGDLSNKTVSGIFPTADPEKCCVVSKGIAYIVSVNDPKCVERVTLFPVLSIHHAPAPGLLIFVSYNAAVAYDQKGLKWQTRRISQDGFEVNAVEGEILKGSFWDTRSDRNTVFEVNLAEGTVTEHNAF